MDRMIFVLRDVSSHGELTFFPGPFLRISFSLVYGIFFLAFLFLGSRWSFALAFDL